MAVPKANHNRYKETLHKKCVVFNILKEWQCQKQITTPNPENIPLILLFLISSKNGSAKSKSQLYSVASV
jgi:hypothetical protein